MLLYLPGQTELRQLAQESTVVSALTEALPPQRVMDAVGGIDPFAAIVGPAAGVDAPDPAIARDPQVRAARSSVVRVRGFACGLGIEGSGWIVRPGYVVTNAHVVAGVESPFVDRGDGRTSRARVVSFDARNDVAVLRLPGLRGRSLDVADPKRGEAAALLGFPGNGPYRVTPCGWAARRRWVRGTHTAASNSAGRSSPCGATSGAATPAARSSNERGQVVGTVFAARRGSDDGFAVPNEQVQDAVANAGPALSTACVAR